MSQGFSTDLRGRVIAAMLAGLSTRKVAPRCGVGAATAGEWRQTRVDNAGGYFALVGGPDNDGLRLDMTRISDKAPYMRMIWRNIEKEFMDWHWQRSPDEGKTWQDSWVIH